MSNLTYGNTFTWFMRPAESYGIIWGVIYPCVRASSLVDSVATYSMGKVQFTVSQELHQFKRSRLHIWGTLGCRDRIEQLRKCYMTVLGAI